MDAAMAWLSKMVCFNLSFQWYQGVWLCKCSCCFQKALSVASSRNRPAIWCFLEASYYLGLPLLWRFFYLWAWSSSRHCYLLLNMYVTVDIYVLQSLCLPWCLISAMVDTNHRKKSSFPPRHSSYFNFLKKEFYLDRSWNPSVNSGKEKLLSFTRSLQGNEVWAI